MVRLRRNTRFQTKRKETVLNDPADQGSEENASGRYVRFKKSSSIRNKRIRSRSLLVLMALFALVLVAIAMLA